MPFDPGLAQRLREHLQAHPDIVEKKMFGGLAFMFRGNMLVGVLDEALVARVGPDTTTLALARPHARPFDFTGKPMKGYVFVAAEGLADDAALAAWVALCLAFVGQLPAK